MHTGWFRFVIIQPLDYSGTLYSNTPVLIDYAQHLFIEKGVRGGISMTSKRHTKLNSPGVPGYDSNEQHNHIMCYDANNLYGWAMSQPLPYSGFKWVDKPPAEPGKGCILEVDLEYAAELHDFHNDYPLVPERLKVKRYGSLTTSQTCWKITACSIPRSWSRISETIINMFCITEICNYTCPSE